MSKSVAPPLDKATVARVTEDVAARAGYVDYQRAFIPEWPREALEAVILHQMVKIEKLTASASTMSGYIIHAMAIISTSGQLYTAGDTESPKAAMKHIVEALKAYPESGMGRPMSSVNASSLAAGLVAAFDLSTGSSGGDIATAEVAAPDSPDLPAPPDTASSPSASS